MKLSSELEKALGKLQKLLDDPDIKPQVLVKVIELRIKYTKELDLIEDGSKKPELNEELRRLKRQMKVMQDRLTKYEEIYGDDAI